MRRTFWPVCATGLMLLPMPAGASAGTPDAFQRLAERNLRPAPLVPTTAPPSLSPFDETISLSNSRRRGGYMVRLVRDAALPSRAAVIALEGGGARSLRASRSYYTRRQGYKARSTRVRGRRGYLLTRRAQSGGLSRYLIWSEDRRVYELGSATPRKVSLRQLRATAAGLEQLGGWYIGSVTDAQDNSQEADFTPTESTLSGRLSWTAGCVDSTGAPSTSYAGSMTVFLAAVRGGGFSFPLRETGDEPRPWTGSVSGTVRDDAIDVSFRATASFDGLSCDTGQVSMSLPRSRG